MGEGVAVLGAGGHAKVVIGVLQSLRMPIAGVFDDDPRKKGARILDIPVLGPLADFDRSPSRAVLALGDNATRKRAAARPGEWVTLVHERAWVHPSVRLGAGTVVMAGAVVQPDTVLGRHVIVNTGATVDHDCKLGDFVHIAPGSHLSGTTTLGEGAFLGTGSSTRQGVTIGSWAVVGAGAAVVTDLPSNVTAVGFPAKVTKRPT
jgi:sugar O-acyltransferase (sialic acid O-acetyltransferase NeuD family)